jgi:hypothetical protein
MTISVSTTKTGFDATTDNVASATMMDFANSIDTLFNNTLNGVQAFDRQLFTAAQTLSIASGVLASPTQALVNVSSETGVADTLDTIGVSNNRYAVLKATSGHTITITSGVGNITTSDGSSLTLTGNAAVVAWCLGSQWAIIGQGSGGSSVVNALTEPLDPTPADDSADGYSAGSLWVNLAADRAFINVDPASTIARWKLITPPKNKWSIRAAGAVATGVGIASPTVANAPSSTNDATNTFMTMPSTAAAGNLAGLITTTFNLTRAAHEAVYEWIIKTGSDITSIRYWIGLVDADITNVDTLAAGREFIGFRFSSVVPDVGWQPVLNDGTTQNAAATEIGTVAVDTVYKLRVRIVGTTAYFSVNDSAEISATTNFPSASQDLGMVCRVIPVAASIRNLLFSSAEVRWG